MRNNKKLHTLKIEQRWYNAVMEGDKKAEFRLNDRDYQVGDLIHFTNINGEEYDGMFNLFIITHILPVREVRIGEQGKLDDYVILSITSYETHRPVYDPRRGQI